MRLQKTVKSFEVGGLYIVATPIGNLEDMTFRAVRMLQEADYILAEDTRVTKKICEHFQIETKVVSCHEHNQYERLEQVIADIASEQKTIALVSDAGMPCISDPGAIIVQGLIEHNVAVTVLPGASAGISLYALSGMSEKGTFMFHGFLPTKEHQKRQALLAYSDATYPVLFYESPHRIVKTLKLIQELFADETKICISRELTKLYETLIWCNIAELKTIDVATLDTWKGEIAFALLPQQIVTVYEDSMIYELLQQQINQGIKLKDATKIIAKQVNKPAKYVYALWESGKVR